MLQRLAFTSPPFVEAAPTRVPAGRLGQRAASAPRQAQSQPRNAWHCVSSFEVQPHRYELVRRLLLPRFVIACQGRPAGFSQSKTLPLKPRCHQCQERVISFQVKYNAKQRRKKGGQGKRTGGTQRPQPTQAPSARDLLAAMKAHLLKAVSSRVATAHCVCLSRFYFVRLAMFGLGPSGTRCGPRHPSCAKLER